MPWPDRIDPVTGLRNRTGLVELVSERLDAGDRNGVAILFVRVDRLDLVNSWVGRHGGDEVLAEAARRLEIAGGAARTGGATFAVVLREPVPPHPWAEAVVASLAVPLAAGGLTITPSFAATLVTTDGFHHDAEVLVDDAEQAARRLLRHGRRPVERVHLAIGDGTPAASDPVASRFAGALDAGEIVAEYQPIIDLRTMAPVGAEALARWRGSPSGGEPEVFLDVARALGREREVVDRILHQACTDFASGPAAEQGWWVAVNLSVNDCADQTLTERVRAALDATGLEPRRLMLEVSERAIPDPAVERSLRNLVRLGVRLAIDDFGTGWSSLAQLRSLPISQIKIDRSLVANRTPDDARLMTATVALANALGLETLAEGVETGEDLLLLCIAECSLAQGFWWSAAAPLDVIIDRFDRSAPPASTGGRLRSLPAPPLDRASGEDLEAELRSLAPDLPEDPADPQEVL